MRSITPIIAIIILILITISAAGAAFLWIQLVQSQVAGESETGLSTNLMEMHGRMTIESVMNRTGQLCMIIRNSGSIRYEQSSLLAMTVYIKDSPYMINTTTLTSGLDPESRIFFCLCTAAETASPNCRGVLQQGYTYDGDVIDITLEMPVGTGDSFNDYLPSSG